MLGNCIPAYEINQLLAYKRILTFKYCNPHYAGCTSVNDIAGKVIRLTAGCVSRCNEPTVCEITTCAVEVVPNPTTTTTSTSSTSTTTTTSTSTSSTTTTTTTIYPDCRIEGCFEELTTTTTTSSTSSTTTTASDTWKFYLAGDGVVNYAPFPAELKTPASGSTVTLSDGKATFTWEGTDPDSGDTLSYTVYVDKVDGKQTPTSALSNLSAQTADVELDAGTTYYWRVKTSDGTNASYSIVYSFKTQ